MASNIEKVNKNECTGCGACYNLCPVNAITMEPDGEGFLFPSVNKELCTTCGLCYSKCPAEGGVYPVSGNGDVYACWAEDDIRMKSSSGGVFSILSKYILSQGGAVAGAAWSDDYKVKHIIIRSEDELDRLRGSKYLQSDVGSVYSEIKALLEKDVPVLFSGCPCQVAGLYAAVGKQYKNLFTVDIVCHGVPSPKAFDKYIEELDKGKKPQNVDFRDKKRGWGTYSSIILNDGTEYFENCREDPYYIAFLNSISTRRSCAKCKYSSPERIGDITLGDFWGISEIDPSYNDGKGTGLVIVNTEKGMEIFEKISPLLKMVNKVSRERTLEIAKRKNGQLMFPRPMHKNRDAFFANLDKLPFSEAAYSAAEKKYDVGIVGWWYNENYGGTLTYFALHQILRSMGLSVLMIEKSAPDGYVPNQDTVPRRFAAKHYKISNVYRNNKMGELNEKCSAFVSGSDQLFNPALWQYSGPQYFLDFASPEKRLVSYASSFGNTIKCSDKHKMMMSYFLHRFDAISVREDYAVDLLSDNFGLKAKKVLDPVFVCDPNEYHRLAESSQVKPEEKYLVSFILDPDAQKKQAILYLSEKLGLPYVNLLNAVNIEENSRKLGLDNIKPGIDIEDFLSYYKNADFIITDSFHGTCFAIIFQKPFISISNKKRGAGRFASMLDELGLIDRMVENIFDIEKKPELQENIDYSYTSARLSVLRKDSYEWLRNAITAPFDKAGNEFNILDNKINKLVNTVWELNAQINSLKQDLNKNSMLRPRKGIIQRIKSKLRRN